MIPSADSAKPEWLVVMGASAGGVGALSKVVAGLPSRLPAAVLVVLHVRAGSESVLPQILSRAGPLPAVHPSNGSLLQNGRIFVAPPDRHLLVNDGGVSLTRGPRENLHRPSIDVLFRSAAVAHGAGVIGVLLTGMGDDGVAGLKAIQFHGGRTIVQNPDDSEFPQMPLSALGQLSPTYQASLDEIPVHIAKLTAEPPSAPFAQPCPGGAVVPGLVLDTTSGNYRQPDQATGVACPECGGSLWEVTEAGAPRFRCRVGHAYSPQALLQAQSGTLERALWAAVRALEESAAISRRVAGNVWQLKRQFEERAQEREEHAAVIRELLYHEGGRDPAA